MVRWCYKTIHFALKKDGLLGGAFLDDVEMEESLNHYGQAGWELVAVFETRDGVMAVFKQPIGEWAGTAPGFVAEVQKDIPGEAPLEQMTAAPLSSSQVSAVRPPLGSQGIRETSATRPKPDELRYHEDVEDEPTEKEAGDDDNDAGVGAIRIE